MSDCLPALTAQHIMWQTECPVKHAFTKVELVMRRDGVYDVIGGEWYFSTVHEAVQHCVRHRHLLGKTKAVEDENLAAVGEENEVAEVQVVGQTLPVCPQAGGSRGLLFLHPRSFCGGLMNGVLRTMLTQLASVCSYTAGATASQDSY